MQELPKAFFKMYILLRDPEGMYSSPEPAKLPAPFPGWVPCRTYHAGHWGRRQLGTLLGVLRVVH